MFSLFYPVYIALIIDLLLLSSQEAVDRPAGPSRLCSYLRLRDWMSHPRSIPGTVHNTLMFARSKVSYSHIFCGFMSLRRR